jgi:hypothetical protein
MDFRHRILPFYMTYPEVTGRFYEQDRDVMRDLEYLQQLYPLEVRYFQRILLKVREVCVKHKL